LADDFNTVVFEETDELENSNTVASQNWTKYALY
jgi:hypothetical protein